MRMLKNSTGAPSQLLTVLFQSRSRHGRRDSPACRTTSRLRCTDNRSVQVRCNARCSERELSGTAAGAHFRWRSRPHSGRRVASRSCRRLLDSAARLPARSAGRWLEREGHRVLRRAIGRGLSLVLERLHAAIFFAVIPRLYPLWHFNAATAFYRPPASRAPTAPTAPRSSP